MDFEGDRIGLGYEGSVKADSPHLLVHQVVVVQVYNHVAAQVDSAFGGYHRYIVLLVVLYWLLLRRKQQLLIQQALYLNVGIRKFRFADHHQLSYCHH